MPEIKDIVAEREKFIPSFDSDFDKFQYFADKLKNALQVLQPIFNGLMFDDYCNKQIAINWNNPDYREAFELYTEIELMMLSGHVYWGQWETAFIKIYLDRISAMLSGDLDEAFKTEFEKTYNTVLDINEQEFWEKVFNAKMSF